MNKIDRRVAKTDRAIFKAFVELLTQKDMKDISILDIAERADVNRGTIYRHYEDKYDLFDHWVYNQLRTVFVEVSGDKIDSMELDDVFYAVLRYLEKNLRTLQRIMVKQKGSLFKDRLSGILQKVVYLEVDTKMIHDELDGTFASQCLSGTLISAIEWWLNQDKMIPATDMVSQIKGIYSLDPRAIKAVVIK